MSGPLKGHWEPSAELLLSRSVSFSLCLSVLLPLVQVAENEDISLPIKTSLDELESVLGVCIIVFFLLIPHNKWLFYQPAKYSHEVYERLTRPGVAVGLAWTSVGGEIMFIEASKMQGSGELILTGQLGDVMKESAQIAVNWVRSNSQQVNLSAE